MHLKTNYQRILRTAILAVAAFSFSIATAGASEDNTILTRERLLDFEGSPLPVWRDKGIDVDFSMIGFGQKQAQGDGRGDFETGGKTRAVITLNGQKLGLWPGIFFQLDHEYVFGDYAGGILDGDGAIIPVNSAHVFPGLDGDDGALSWSATQAFSEDVMFSAGVFNAAGLAASTPILGGGGVDTFMNSAIAAPISGVVPPYFAGGVLTVKTEPASLTFLAYDPGNADDSDVLENLFSDGATFSVSSVFPVTIGGHQGYQSISGYYSTADGFDLSNLPQLILPPDMEDTTIGATRNYWYISYAFQQILFPIEGGQNKGWGIFGEAGISDGNPNPVQGHVFIGVGGDSMIQGRSGDKWGVAYFYYAFSDELKNATALVDFIIEEESGVEMFYNFAMTPWSRLSADIQYIDPARADRDNALYLGLRAEIKF